MAWFAFGSLVLWLPVVFYLFEKYPLQKAIVFSFVAAWLFLPPTQISLPAFPDWSKTTATSVSVSLCCYLKYPGRLMAFRPKWYDLPVIVFCCCPFISSVMNGLGAYDGFSAVLDELVRWGMPYVISRVYLGDANGNRQLSLGLAVGGLIYVPLCLYEIRMSPVLKTQVFGFGSGRDVDFGLRYGGYRPMVFLSTGLELGWWMCCASLAAYMLWKSGSVRRILGYPMAAMTAGLVVVTVACKSTGALLQLFVGVVLIHVSRRTKQAWLVWALLLVAPIYCIVRPTGLWSGIQVVEWSSATFGADRAQSLGFRFEQEEILMQSANQRLLFGWGRNGGFNTTEAGTKAAITDGLWIIVYGWAGWTGLASLNLMLLVPAGLFLVRFKPATWFEPEVAPVATLAIILPLFMIDNLSNGMINPIYALAMGSVTGFIPRRGAGEMAGSRRSQSEVGSTPLVPPPGIGRRGLRQDAVLDNAADEAETLAIAADGADRYEEAYELFRESIRARQAAIGLRPSPARLDRLAHTHVLNARFLTRIEQLVEAIGERERALGLWREIQTAGRGDAFARDIHASNLNDLAWLLVADEGAAQGEVERAIPLAEEAVTIGPTQASFWNTLGIARYRHRDFYKAIHALSRAVSLGGGGNAFDYYYLALANHALGYAKPATEWFDRAEAWALRHPEFGPVLDKVRVESIGVFADDRVS